MRSLLEICLSEAPTRSFSFDEKQIELLKNALHFYGNRAWGDGGDADEDEDQQIDKLMNMLGDEIEDL